MTRSLGDLAAAALFFGAVAREFTSRASELEAAALALEAEAKSYPGNYQPGWAPLKETTIARKTTGDSPLLETGELRDSITHSSDAREATVGTNDPRMKWHEFGTATIPPRPIFAVAIVKGEPAVTAAVGKVVMQRLVK